MNGKKCKALRAQAADKKTYKHLKKTLGAQARTNASQASTAVVVRTHKRKPAIKSTWPHSTDQRKQSRPVIVVRPIRVLVRAIIEMTPPHHETGKRHISQNDLAMVAWNSTMPKHAIDARVRGF